MLAKKTERAQLPEKKLKVLTKAFFGILENWQLSNNDKAKLLGWEYEHKRYVIDEMRKGQRAIDQDDDKITRIIEIINIHKSLRLLFPYDLDLAYQWITEKREVFNRHSALDIMKAEGIMGITAIRKYLDHARTS
jgi:hypothetical protein